MHELLEQLRVSCQIKLISGDSNLSRDFLACRSCSYSGSGTGSSSSSNYASCDCYCSSYYYSSSGGSYAGSVSLSSSTCSSSSSCSSTCSSSYSTYCSLLGYTYTYGYVDCWMCTFPRQNDFLQPFSFFIGHAAAAAAAAVLLVRLGSNAQKLVWSAFRSASQCWVTGCSDMIRERTNLNSQNTCVQLYFFQFLNNSKIIFVFLFSINISSKLPKHDK